MQSQYHFDTDTHNFLEPIYDKPIWSDTTPLSVVETVPPSTAQQAKATDFTSNISDAKLLVVSDEALNAEMIHDFLSDYGYSQIAFTHDITQAFETIFHHQPDAILYETNSLTAAAFNTLERINNNIKTSLIPLVILTSDTDEQTKLKALELGVVDIIAKPASEKELALRLRNILSVKTYHDQVANYDSLTKLPNLQSFMTRLDWALKYSKRYKTTGAVLQVGIKNLDKIHDAYGMTITDQLIKQIVTRIQFTIRDTDIVASTHDQEIEATISRISNSEFSLLLPVIEHTDDAAIASQRLYENITKTYLIEDKELYVESRIGIAIFPNDGNAESVIMKAANVALHQAKANNDAHYIFYSDELNKLSTYRINMENNLRKALDEDQFEMYYQPKICIKSKKLIGAEALLRWKHPELGFISPEEFIPIAEETGNIFRLGSWVTNTVIKQIKQWQDSGITVPRIAINISGHQFKNNYIADEIRTALENANLDGRYLTIELTETAMMDNTQEIVESLNALKALGIKLSIDDFGTGYSSLVQLKELPLDELKIDRNFTWDIAGENNTEAIILAIIAMARSLKLNVVAEGVETEEQLAFLEKQHCNEYQGYLFSPAIPADEFGMLIA